MSPITGHRRAAQPPAEHPAETPEFPETIEAAVEVETRLGHAVLAAGTETEIVARVRLRPSTLRPLPRAPVSVALVLDTSASMAGDAIVKAQEAARSFVGALDDTDRVALVVFHSLSEVRVPLTALGEDGRKALSEAIDGLEATGTTNLVGGLAHGLAEVRKGMSDGGAGRIVLLSDGVPNDRTHVLSTADQAKGSGITVTALGLGLEYDETLLGQIAQRSGGAFRFAETPDQVAEVFKREVIDLQRVVGRHAQLTLTAGPGVTILDAVGQHTSMGAHTASMPVGDLVEGRPRDLFVRLRTTAHRAGAPIELLDAQLRFHDTLSGKGRIQRTFIAAKASDDATEIDASTDDDVLRAAARAITADAAVDAIAIAQSGRVSEARKLLDTALKNARRAAKRFDDAQLRDQVAELKRLRTALRDFAPARARPRHAKHRSRPRPGLDALPEVKQSHAKAMGMLGN